MMKRALVLLAAIVSLNAQVFELDQGFDSGASGGIAVLDDQTLGQTFTVGIEGTLHEVHLNLFHIGNPADDLMLWIYRPSTGEAVDRQRIPLDLIPEGMENSAMVPITLNSPIALQAGSTWEMRLTSANSSVFHAAEWSRVSVDAYPGGQGRVLDSSGNIGDFSFFTFMEPQVVPTDNLTAVPEPGTYAMIFAVGLLGFIVTRKLRS